MSNVKKLVKHVNRSKKIDLLKFKENFERLIREKALKKLEQEKKKIAKKLFSESTESTVNNVESLKNIVSGNSIKKIKFENGQELAVDVTTAKAVLDVLNSLKSPESIDKYTKSINRDEQSFMLAVNIAYKNKN